MKKLILIAVVLICSITLSIFSQETAIESNYLGYPKPGSTPEIFAPDFVSTQNAEFAGTFAPDFSEFYFTRRGPFPNGIAQVMHTQKVAGIWSSPIVANFSSNNYEYEPHITPDGMRLYFGSRRPLLNKPNTGQMHQWYLEKENSIWSEPKLLGSPFFVRMVMYPSVSNNKTIFFTDLDGIYYSKFINDIYQQPIKLGPEINFLPLTAHSFIAPDESYLMFDGQPRGEGKTDIYISYKKQDSSWTKGKFMGTDINSGESQAMASVSPDGECIFFTRNSDIYWMDAAIIEEIKLIPKTTISPSSGSIPLKVNFTIDLSTVPEPINEFEWDFNGDGIIDSRLQNPEFTYLHSGIYSISLKLTATSGSAFKIFTDAVKVGVPDLKIHYLGHSSFVLQFDNGITVVTDYGHYNAWAPSWDSPIYDIGDLLPTIMTYSHTHDDHYDPDRIPDSLEYLLFEFDSLNIDGLRITPIRVCENSINVEDNTAFLFEYKGIKFLHLGDAQTQIMNIENEEILNHISEIIPDSLDMLFMTIEGQQQFIEEAEFFINLLKPKRVIPMHYWSTDYKMEFLSYLSGQNSSNSNYEIIYKTDSKFDIYESDIAAPIQVISLVRSSFYDNTSIEENDIIGSKFILNQNHPNPFITTTKISYSLQKEFQVKLVIIDSMGHEISTLVDKKQLPGDYEVNFNATNLSRAIYYYKLIAGNTSQTKVMILH